MRGQRNTITGLLPGHSGPPINGLGQLKAAVRVTVRGACTGPHRHLIRRGLGSYSASLASGRAKLHVSTEEFDEGVIILLSGRLDATNSHVLEEILEELFDDGHDVLLFDLAQLRRISSAGLRVLLLAARETQTLGGVAVVCGLDERVRRKFAVVGFDKVIAVHGSIEEALDAL